MEIIKINKGYGNFECGYYKGDKFILHREDDEPAQKLYHYRAWYQHGKFHRENGLPARTWADGSQEWLVHGRHHRLDGPAIEYDSAICKKEKSYWINGERVDGRRFKTLVKQYLISLISK
jgi:hypothetical protein